MPSNSAIVGELLNRGGRIGAASNDRNTFRALKKPLQTAQGQWLVVH